MRYRQAEATSGTVPVCSREANLVNSVGCQCEFLGTYLLASKTREEGCELVERCLGRCVVAVCRPAEHDIPVPEIPDPRPARQAKNITLTNLANHFGVWAHGHLNHRTRHPPPLRPRKRLPHMAQRRLTANTLDSQ